MTDFEYAILSSVKETMPKFNTLSCQFHHRQALRKNLGKRGLIKKLKSDANFRHCFHLFVALSFVPIQDVKVLFDMMLQEESFHQDLIPYANQYYRGTWIESPEGGAGKYPLDCWNYFERFLYTFLSLQFPF